MTKETHCSVLKKAVSFLPWVSLPQHWPVFYKLSVKTEKTGTMPSTESNQNAWSFSHLPFSISFHSCFLVWFFLMVTFFEKRKGQWPPASSSLLSQRHFISSSGWTALPGQQASSSTEIEQKKNLPLSSLSCCAGKPSL